MLTPSSVMLIELCGSPLTVESRTVPGVWTPGRNCVKSSALRVPTGRLRWFVLIVVDAAADWVWMIADAPSTRPFR